MCMIVSWMMLNVHFMESWDHSISTQMWCASQMRDTSSAAVAIRIFCSWWASCSSFSTKEARNCYSKQFITFCNNLTMLNILWHSKYVENMCFASCFHNMNPSPAPHFATKTCVVPRRPSPSTASRTAARRFSRSLRSANHACDGGSQQSAIFMPFLMGKNPNLIVIWGKFKDLCFDQFMKMILTFRSPVEQGLPFHTPCPSSSPQSSVPSTWTEWNTKLTVSWESIV